MDTENIPLCPVCKNPRKPTKKYCNQKCYFVALKGHAPTNRKAWNKGLAYEPGTTGGYGKRRPLAERFWEKVDKKGEDECWLWTAGLDGAGYGKIKDIGGANLLTHRVSFWLHHGFIDDNLMVLHSCDVRRCVNPRHLRQGTARDNVHDIMKRRGMTNKPRKDKKPRQKWNPRKLPIRIFSIVFHRYYPKDPKPFAKPIGD